MGDPRRFDMFAELVLDRLRPHGIIADVAGGKGHLQSALRHRGYTQVVSWDKNRRHARGQHRRFYKHGLFDYRSAPRDYECVVGMHPDEASDHIIGYAIKHQVPFAVCPCCVKPSAFEYGGQKKYDEWCGYLAAIAVAAQFKIERINMNMRGCSHVIYGQPPLRLRRG